MTAVSAIGANYLHAPIADEVAWQLKGSCSTGDYDPELWTPYVNHEIEALKAKEICYQCPVVRSCAKWALDHHETHGVWGALSEGDRLAIWTGRTPRRRYNRKTVADILGQAASA